MISEPTPDPAESSMEAATEPLLAEASAALNTPLLEIGSFAITPFFLIKAATLIIVLIVMASLVRRRLVFRLLRNSNVDQGVKYAVARIGAYGVWTFGMLIGLPIIGIQLDSLFVAFGAVGIGIGLGLQKIAENFISGLLILFARPIKVGDRIHVGDLEGTVIEIQSRVTLVQTNDNIVVLVPNAQLVSEQVINLTHNDKLVRYGFDIGVSYEADPNTVRDCLLAVAKEHKAILASPAPDVLFLGFGDSSINFRLRGYSTSMVHIPDTLKSEINFAIWYRLEKEGITIPFPQRDLHIKSMPAAMAAPPSA